MSKLALKIAYDGLAANGSFDAKELGYSLLALSAIFQEADLVLNKSRSSVSVIVKAGFTAGSFELTFEVVQSLLDRFLSFFPTEKNYSAKDIAELLGFVVIGGAVATKGVIQAVKFLKGRKSTIRKIPNGRFKLITGNGELEIEGDALKLLSNGKIRSNLFDLIKPLQNPGVDKFEVREDKDPVVSIKKEECDYFRYSIENERTVSENTVEKVCEIRSLSFEKDLSWKLFDGEQKFNARLLDENFFKNIESESVSFKKGDKFKMKIRTKQTDDGFGNIKTYHEIEEVIEKYKTPEQLNFDLPIVDKGDV